MKSTWLLLCLPLAACSKPSGEESAVSTPQSIHAAPAHAAEPSARPPAGGHRPRAKMILDPIDVPNQPSTVNILWKIPEGTAVNHDAPLRIRWKSSEALENAPEDINSTGSKHEDGFRIALHPTKGATEARLLGELELVVCDSDSHSICIPVKREVDLSFQIGGTSAPKPIELPLPAARG